jgi:hypothetical protein
MLFSIIEKPLISKKSEPKRPGIGFPLKGLKGGELSSTALFQVINVIFSRT